MERFWSKVKKTDSCWLWTAKTDGGYGRFWYEGRLVGAHRFSWLLANDEMPSLHVLHKCDNPLCVNPDHLFLGTDKDNHLDRDIKGKNGRAILTQDQVKDIINSQEKQNKLAERYGVHESQISRIKRNKAWRHVQRVYQS